MCSPKNSPNFSMLNLSTICTYVISTNFVVKCAQKSRPIPNANLRFWISVQSLTDIFVRQVSYYFKAY